MVDGDKLFTDDFVCSVGFLLPDFVVARVAAPRLLLDGVVGVEDFELVGGLVFAEQLAAQEFFIEP
ncbi:MAG: hypothetical protein ACRCWR_07260 [Saezia sp.]